MFDCKYHFSVLIVLCKLLHSGYKQMKRIHCTLAAYKKNIVSGMICCMLGCSTPILRCEDKGNSYLTQSTQNDKAIVIDKKFTHAHATRDGFTHRRNGPWPRAPRFWGLCATLFYDDSMLIKICKTAQRYNFTIYLETGGNPNV